MLCINVFKIPLTCSVPLSEVAELVFDKCVQVSKPEEGSQTKLTYKHGVKFNFEFLDDLYSMHEWEKKRYTRRREKMKLKESKQISRLSTSLLHATFGQTINILSKC